MPMATIAGPFGPAQLREQLPASVVAAMYRAKCGAVIDFGRLGVETLDLYECDATGMRFWRPAQMAGDEAFYRDLSRRWPFYYRDWRWEYGPALAGLHADDRLLEIGSGQGYFLKLTEGRVAAARGIELNRQAIADKVTAWPIDATDLRAVAGEKPHHYSVVCSFQVLEHVIDPAQFIAGALDCMQPGGRLVLSTPDPENGALRRREDAFDLPPHHMNHITLAAYRRIADHFGLVISRIDRSPLIPWGSHPPGETRREPLRAIALRETRNLAARLLRRRGPTLMVTLRRP